MEMCASDNGKCHRASREIVVARIYNLSTLNVETKNKNNVFVGDGFFILAQATTCTTNDRMEQKYIIIVPLLLWHM